MNDTHKGIWASFLFVFLLFATPGALEAQSAAAPPGGTPAPTGPTVPDSGSDCNGTYTGTFNGNLTVSAGQSCIFTSGGVTGDLRQNGGTLTLNNSQVTGNVQITGASTFAIGPGVIVGGNLQIQKLPAPTDPAAPAGEGAAPAGGCPAPAGGGAAPAAPAAPAAGGAAAPPAGGCAASTYQVCGTTVQGDLQVKNNGIAAVIGGSCGGNTIDGNLQVQNNTADTAVDGNTVSGNLQDQNNAGPDAADVENNTVSSNLQCHNNTPGTSSSNNTVTGNNQCYQ